MSLCASFSSRVAQSVSHCVTPPISSLMRCWMMYIVIVSVALISRWPSVLSYRYLYFSTTKVRIFFDITKTFFKFVSIC